jgi:hypothetical protein
MMSASARAARRGAVTESWFLDMMRRLGFVVEATRPPEVWAFSHPDTPDHRYSMMPREDYGKAWVRMRLQMLDIRRRLAA